jgi:hypothetical protein
VHGESTPAIQLEMQEPANDDTTTTLQLTQEQLAQLLQAQQQQMLQDLEGENGEMM